MTSRRFFATVWRINSIAILATTLIAFCVLLYAMWQIFREATRTRYVSNVVNVADEQLDRSEAQLGGFEAIEGSSVLRAPLRIEQEYGFSSGSKETCSVQNYFFYDSSDARAYWLIPGYEGLILETRDLPEREYSGHEKPLVVVVYELVEVDSTGDKKLTASDLKTVAVSNPGGSKLTRILTDVEEVNGTHITSNGRVLVLYTAASVFRAAEIDPIAQTIIRDAPLRTAGQAGEEGRQGSDG